MRVIAPQALLRRALDDPESPAGAMRVTEFLTSIPAIGEGKRDRILQELEISPVKKLGGLGARQRRAMQSFLDDAMARARPAGRAAAVWSCSPDPPRSARARSPRRSRRSIPRSTCRSRRRRGPARPGEIEGEHYFFVDDAEFDRLVADGELLEHATVHNRYRYGTPRRPIDDALARGQTVLLEIDLQGARQVRAAEPSATLVFLLPPSWDELVHRLVGRGTEDAEERARRLRTAKVELASQNEFDYRVVNEDVASAAREVVELVKAPAR